MKLDFAANTEGRWCRCAQHRGTHREPSPALRQEVPSAQAAHQLLNRAAMRFLPRNTGALPPPGHCSGGGPSFGGQVTSKQAEAVESCWVLPLG